MNAIKNTIFRFRRLLISLLAVFVIYTLAGVFLVPWLAEKQLVKTMEQRLEVTTTVQRIAFNPYTFELKVGGLKLATAESESLGEWDKLYINVDPIHLFKLDVMVDEISLTSPKLYFHRYSASDNTLTRLANNWNNSAEPAASDTVETTEQTDNEAPLLTLMVNKLNYSSGALHYVDDVPAEKFETVLSPINIHLTDFSTQAGQAASNDIVIDLENDAELKLNGNLVLSPLRLDGQLSLKNLSLQTPYRYVHSMLPFELKQGRLNLGLAYNVDMNGEDTNVQLNNINLDLADFSIHQAGDDLPLLKAGQLTLSDGQFSYPNNALNIASVTLDDYTVSATQNEQGQLNWLQMLGALPAEKDESASTEETATPLELEIASIAINNSRVNVEDRMPESPVNLSLGINSALKNFSLKAGNQMPVSANVTLESGGSIDLNGDLQLFPAFALNSEVNIKQLALQPVQSYLEQFAFVELKKGGIDSSLNIATNPDEPFAVKGDLALVDAQVDNDKLKEKLLGLDRLAFNNIDFSLAKQNLAISEITVDKLFSRIKINQGGETNIGQLIKENPESKPIPPETEKGAGSDYTISVGQITVNDASSSYTDENLPIVFNADMKKLNGKVSGFSTESQHPMNITLEGQVDDFGLVEINGDMNPLDVANQTNIKLVFTNLSLPELTPYTIKFAGREIDEGAADINLDYELVKGELNANNKLLIKDIRLGKRVESPDAMDLPLDLAIALLKNSDGIIDLSIPVTGNVNDPEFDIGPVVRKAVANVIGNIVTAPFRFLAGLFGGDGEPVKDLRFRAGRSDIAPPEQEKLLKLAGALEKRPQLALRIPAPFDNEADREVLKQKAVEARIEAQLKDTAGDTQLLEKTLQVLESLYLASGLSPDIDTIKQQLVEASKTAETPNGELDTLALNAKLKARLIEAEPITDAELNKLAVARQQQVIDFILANSELKQQQLLAGETITQKVDDGWVVLPFKLDAL